jgi:RNA polymerase sigma factor (sigma-70 family)
MDSERRALAEAHLPLLKSIAWEFFKGAHDRWDFDDLVGAGAVGLCQAARRFRPGRQTFGSFACIRIRGAIVDWMRRDGRWNRGQVARWRVTGVDEVDIAGPKALGELLDDAPPADEQLADAQVLARARARIAAMDPRTRRLMDLIYVDGLDGKAAGDVLGITKPWVCQLRKRAIRELQRAA